MRSIASGRILLIPVLAVLSVPARAQTPPLTADPSTMALVQMLQEAQQREAMALIRAITAERLLQQARAELAAAKAGGSGRGAGP